MKKIKNFVLLCAVVIMSLFTSCEEGLYEESLYVKGDKVQVVTKDNIVYRDSIVYKDSIVYRDSIVYEEKIVTIETDKEFDCYDFKYNGNIEGHTKGHAEMKEFSYNFQMDAAKEVFFISEPELGEAAFKVSPEQASFNNGMAIFHVENGEERRSVTVVVPGSNSVTVNSKEIFPCNPFAVRAELEKSSNNKTIDGKEYEVAVVTYTFLNSYEEAVKSITQELYSPVKEDEPEEPVNEKTITLSYEDVNGELIVTGLVDNTIDTDERFSVRIPRILSIETEERKVVNGQNLTLSVGANPSEVSNNVVNNFSKNDGNLVVTYNEVEAVYSQFVTASGNNVELKQNVRYYNTFVAELYGERLEINLPVSVSAEKMEGTETVNNGTISCLYNINYTASQSSLTASASQEVEIVMSAISFSGERVIYANRTVTFDKLQSAKVYDCVVTSVSTGGHNFKYREVYADGTKGVWNSESLSSENFQFIEDGMKNSNAALAIYNHKNIEGLRVGYLRDFLSIASQVIYFAHNNPQSTFDNVNATMFGRLESCILGAVKTVGNSLEMTCIAGYYNNNLISPSETMYFY